MFFLALVLLFNNKRKIFAKSYFFIVGLQWAFYWLAVGIPKVLVGCYSDETTIRVINSSKTSAALLSIKPEDRG